MNDLENIKHFLNKRLVSKLEEASQQRNQEVKALMRKLLPISLMLMVIYLALIVTGQIHYLNYQFPLHYWLIIGAYVFFISRFVLRSKAAYDKTYKEKVVVPLIRTFSSSFSLKTEQRIDDQTLLHSGLFNDDKRFSGNDLVTGYLQDTRVTFSDIKKERKSGSGKNSEIVTVFQGLVFVAELAHSAHSHTRILPDTAENLFGSTLGHWFQSFGKNKDLLVTFSDKVFEKHFVVYSDNEALARRLLNTDMITQLLRFTSALPGQVAIALNDNKLYLSVDDRLNHFEGNYFESKRHISKVEHQLAIVHLSLSLLTALIQQAERVSR